MTAAQAATLSLATTVIGGAVSAYGQIQQGRAAQGQYNYQAAVDRNNSILADRAKEDALKQGDIEERKTRLRTQQLKGEQRAGYAENNIDLGSETVSDVLSDTAMIGELDALTVRNNAERTAYEYQVQSDNYKSSAANNNLAGKNAKSASVFNAGTTLLGTASTVSDRWSDYQSKGVFKTKKTGT